MLGQVTEVETLTVANNMSYAPFGPLTGLTFGNGLVLSRTLDQQYRLTDQTTGTIQDIDFTLDAAGNVDAITDWVNTSLSQGFSQDALSRAGWFEAPALPRKHFLASTLTSPQKLHGGASAEAPILRQRTSEGPRNR